MEIVYKILLWIFVAYQGGRSQVENCELALGMKDKLIPDESIKASSTFSSKHSPSLARLDGQGAWCPSPEESPYMEILLDEEKLITSVTTQGSGMDAAWARKYQIKYIENGNWTAYPKVLTGNINSKALKTNTLLPPIRTRSIRIYPKDPRSASVFQTNLVACLRIELYGCSAPVGGGWSPWGKWSPCSVTCGIGHQVQTRTCTNPAPQHGGEDCQGPLEQSRPCEDKKHCPIGGGWSLWGKWSPCSMTCGKGHQVQIRTCTNPAPQHGGEDCQGPLEHSRPCEDKKHCPIDGGWSEWGTWSGCSLTYCLGHNIRTRLCNNPEPKYDGKPCNKTEGSEMGYCRFQRCETEYSGSGSGWETDLSGSGLSRSVDGWEESSGEKAWRNEKKCSNLFNRECFTGLP